MTELLSEKRREERPDPGGVVRRGTAAEEVRGFFTTGFGEPPCHVRSRKRDPDERCQIPAVMEVYGLWMCEIHGEEAAGMALEELAYDLEQELRRPQNEHWGSLSPHMTAALNRGFGVLPDEANDYDGHEAELLAAWPLNRERVASEILAFVKDPPRDERGLLNHDPMYDTFMQDRLVIHRHMRLAFEGRDSWLVEILEREREYLAEQTAYALALEIETGLRSAPGEAPGEAREEAR